MPGRFDRRVSTAFYHALTAILLLGLVLFGRWFVGTVGGELDRGGLLLSLGLVVVSAGIKLSR